MSAAVEFKEIQHYLDNGFSFVLSGDIVSVYSTHVFLRSVELYSGDKWQHAFFACDAWMESN